MTLYARNIRSTQVCFWLQCLGAYRSKGLYQPNTKNSDKTLTKVFTKHTGPFIVYIVD